MQSLKKIHAWAQMQDPLWFEYVFVCGKIRLFPNGMESLD